MRFESQVVVVTGGAGGIGLATAKAFAREGAQLVITDVHEGQLGEATQAISAEGGRVTSLPGDVSDPAQVEAHVRTILERFGRVDVLVNNAGIIRRGPTAQVAVDTWRLVMSVNLDGTFYWAQAVAAQSMIPRRAGAIVNIASLGGIVGFPNAASYVASKHGVVGLTKALAIDWGQYNIRVNAVCPGLTWSNLSKADFGKNPKHYAVREPRIPLGHAANPEEQASAVLFLASADASHVHGLIMNIDGGQLALSSGHSAPRDPVDSAP
jgi:NAD(P)-dependent dehydrogenase (short-subunit alcohol dehydrogenase family)